MTGWTHGYFATSGGYTYGTYPETMPSRLWFSSLIQGHVVKRSGFRYLDLGCGQGFNLVLAASMHPDSEFVGVDFMPEHVAHGTKLAQEAGITNVRFIEADFMDLAVDPSPLGAPFDYAIAHGITSWVAPAVREAIYAILGKSLTLGGVFYKSYNTFPGWLPAVPFQHMIAEYQRKSDGHKAFQQAVGLFSELQSVGAGIFPALPALKQRIETASKLDPAYLGQEYGNQFWWPEWVSKVIPQLEGHKLTYLGSATLTEVFEGNYPQNMRELLSKAEDKPIREQTRDLIVNQAFRRDLYVKGSIKTWALSLIEIVGQVRVMANPFGVEPKEGESFVFGVGAIEVKGGYESYHKLLSNTPANAPGITIAELATKLAIRPQEAAMMVTMLLHGGWLCLVNPAADAAKKTVSRLTQHLADSVTKGAPYRFVSSATTGAVYPMSEIDLIALEYLSKHKDLKAAPEYVLEALARLNKQILKEGNPLAEKSDQLDILKEQLKNTELNLEKWKRLGLS